MCVYMNSKESLEPCDKNLSPEEHGDLNIPAIVYPGGPEARDQRIAELRKKYIGNQFAQYQLDRYDGPNTEYKQKLYKYREALKKNDLKGQEEYEIWFKEKYPDIEF